MSVQGFVSRSFPVSLSLGVAVLFTPSLWANDVHVVDVSGVTAGAFTDLQNAVDVAGPGDILLVKPGVYQPFVLSNKGLTIVADPPHSVNVATTSPFASDELGKFSDHSRIQGIPAASFVIVRGFTFRGLEILNCVGSVMLEDCRSEITVPTARIAGSSKVLLHRVTFDGADGLASVDLTAFKLGGGGLVINSSQVSLTDCFANGGDGQDYVLSFLGPFPNEPGNPGLVVDQNSTVLLTRVKATGGAGGAAGSDGVVCTNGSPGAPAIDVRSGVVHRKSTQAAGGAGGEGLPVGSCAGSGLPGAAGPPVLLAQNASMKNMPGPAGTLALSSPVRVGQQVAINVIGPGKGTFAILFGAAPTLAPIPSLGGAVLLLAPVANGVFVGSFDLQGSSIGAILLRDLDPGVEGVVILGQALVCDRDGTCSPAAASVIIGVDAQF